MHELPPLIHKERDRMIDVHDTILPLTARPKPHAATMLACAQRLENGLWVFSPTDIVIHSAAHFLADGKLDGGLRNLWDIHCLLSEFSNDTFCRLSSHGPNIINYGQLFGVRPFWHTGSMAL